MDSNLVFLASNLHERKQLLLRLDLVECVSSIFFDRRNLFMAFFIISFHQIFSRPTKCRLVPFGHFFFQWLSTFDFRISFTFKYTPSLIFIIKRMFTNSCHTVSYRQVYINCSTLLRFCESLIALQRCAKKLVIPSTLINWLINWLIS